LHEIVNNLAYAGGRASKYRRVDHKFVCGGNGIESVLPARPITQDACHREGLERSADHMGRTSAIRVVGGLGFNQLSVREDDPELVVQAVEESGKIANVRGSRAIFGHSRGRVLRERASDGDQAALVGEDIRRPSG
jgi:hypothetical protein